MKRYTIAFLILSFGSLCQTRTEQMQKQPHAHEKNQYPTISIFSPGFFEKRSVSTQHVERYAKNNILQGTYVACTYNDNRSCANFGQDGDITILAEHYRGCCNNDANTRIVLAGISRGASTLFNFIGKKKPENIAAIIAESPFALVDDVVEHTISQWHMGWIPGIKYISFALMKYLYPAYNHCGPQPIKSIEHPISAPILIVCSKQDDVIPYTSSVRLAYALQEKGYEVYLLIFQEGAHGYLSYKEEFQHVVNALYARYNLPYNAELAQKGATQLERCKL